MEGGVVVGIAVEGPMHDDACDDFLGILLPNAIRSSPDEITEEISNAGSIGGAGEVDVGKVVQAVSNYGAVDREGRAKPRSSHFLNL